MDSDALLIGAHTSIAGGHHHALLYGKEIGATTVQIFTANQRQWVAKPLTEEAIELFRTTQVQLGLKAIMSHASYLINLGAPDPENLHKSRLAFAQEINRCKALGLTFLNFHPGAALQDAHEAALDRVVASLLACEELLTGGQLRLLLEATAGQGSVLGASFEELGYIVERVKGRLPIGVCIDTCHIFAAGYDIRTPEAWKETLRQFEAAVGLHHLYAFHLNDSLGELGSHKDRHATLGKGKIGLDAFRFLMRDPVLQLIPKYLETPEGMEMWEKEIWMLREFAHAH